MSKAKLGYEGGVASEVRKAEIVEAGKQKIHRLCNPIFTNLKRIKNEEIKTGVEEMAVKINSAILMVEDRQVDVVQLEERGRKATRLCQQLADYIRGKFGQRRFLGADENFLQNIFNYIDVKLPGIIFHRTDRSYAHGQRKREFHPGVAIEDSELHPSLAGVAEILHGITFQSIERSIRPFIRNISEKMRQFDEVAKGKKGKISFTVAKKSLGTAMSRLNSKIDGLKAKEDNKVILVAEKDKLSLLKERVGQAVAVFLSSRRDPAEAINALIEDARAKIRAAGPESTRLAGAYPTVTRKKRSDQDQE